MALFSGKILSTRFIDNSNMTIEVLYKDNDEVISYILSVDFTQDDFKELIEEISLEEIEQSTKKLKFEQSKAINDAIDLEINRRISTNSTKKVAFDDISAKDFFELLSSKNEDNDFIFNTKILILDNSKDQMSKDKQFKMKIRKSKTLMELLDTYTSANMKIK